MELFKANKQWSTRPADETFESIGALWAATRAYRGSAVEAKEVPVSTLRVEATDGELVLLGKAERPATLTNWAFGQLAGRIGAPASYLRDLPATLAAQNVNHGLKRLADGDAGTTNLLLHKNGSYVVRALTSDKYRRIWNSDVAERLEQLVEDQPYWKLPQGYNRFQSETDTRTMAPRGCYASDHDMFVFLIDEDHPVEVRGQTQPLKRGFFVWNSEVGAASFGIMTFLYDAVCGNNIVWGAQNVIETRIRHVGNNVNARAFGQLAVEVRKYAESSVSDLEAQIETAQTRVIGAKRADVMDAIFGKRVPGLTRALVGDAYDRAEKVGRYGAPNTVWALVNGITELSQETTSGADERAELDRAAGKLMAMDF